MDSDEKCLKNEGIDLISNMPDPILCKILSHMPTKYALGTKILSPRWKNLSPFEVPPIKLDLDEKELLYSYKVEHDFRSFVNFVDKLLFETLLDGPSVESVFLRWRDKNNRYGDYDENIDKENDKKIVAWVSAVLRLNVVHLSIRIPTMFDTNVLFHSLNGCTTLVTLELGKGENLDLRIRGEFILHNLKSLFLYSLFFRDDSVDALIGGCPVLNELSFSECEFSENVYIKSPLLKLFVIHNSIFGAEVVFDAPNIEALVYECCNDIPDWVGADFKFLHSAYFAINDNLPSLGEIVKACSSATRLCLSGDSIAALHTNSVQLSAFRKITWLGLDGMDSDGFELLACFLKSAPIVQTLTFARLSTESEDYVRFESLLPTIPVCLKLCLKKIEFLDFKGKEDEMKLVEYFLKNGRVLQEVTLHTRCKYTNIFNRLLMFPKHSKTCQVLVKEYKTPRLGRSLLRRYLSCSSFSNMVSSVLRL